MPYELVALVDTATEESDDIITEIAAFFNRWNEALGNPWPDFAFKPKDHRANGHIHRAHLIGQSEWSLVALIQTVIVAGARWPALRWIFSSPLWGGQEFSYADGALDADTNRATAWTLVFESCLEDPWSEERDPSQPEAPGCFGLFHSAGESCLECPTAARCLSRQRQVHVKLGKTVNGSGLTIRPHQRPRCWLPPVGACLTADHQGEHHEAIIVEKEDFPLGRAILFNGEFYRSLTAASRSVAPHHNTGLTFWKWNGAME